MIRTYTYKLYENKNYKQKFDRWIGVCRCVYNLAKETKEYAYNSQKVNLTKYDLIKQLPSLKKEFPWVAEVNAQTLQDVVERLDNSFQKFFKGGGFPKWAKKNKYNSFKFKQGVKQTNQGFQLPKFGKIKVFNNKKINGKIKQAQLIRKVDGLYIHVVVEVEDFNINKYNNQVGIDMGITYFAVTSEGEYIDNPRFLEKQLKKLRIEQRSLSRKKKGGKNWIKQLLRIKKLHQKVTNCRKDFLHKVSTKIAVENSDIAIEDLKVSKMIQSKYAKHISDVSWTTFFTMLEYKANNLVKVEPFHSSQECLNCGSISKENRTTQSKFLCVSCGYEENADFNAANIILGRAFPNSR